MLEFAADNFPIILFLSILVALGLAVGWWMTRRIQFLYWIVPLLLVVLVAWALTLAIVTDRQRLIKTVEEMSQELKKGNVEKFFQHVASDFRYGAMNKPAFRDYVQSQMRRYQVRDFQTWGLDIVSLSREQKKAAIDFFFRAEGNWNGNFPPLRCEAEFVLEGDRWLLKGFHLKLGNTGSEFHLPAR